VKNGLSCVAACKHCKGCNCENASVEVNVSDDTDGDQDIAITYPDVSDVSDMYDVMSDDGMELVVPWLEEEVV